MPYGTVKLIGWELMHQIGFLRVVVNNMSAKYRVAHKNVHNFIAGL